MNTNESIKNVIDNLNAEELTDLHLSIIKNPIVMRKIEGECLKRDDQLTISDLFKFFSEIDPQIIKDILFQNKDDARVANLLSEKGTNGYGGVTLCRLAKIIVDNLDDTKFDIEALKNKINEDFSTFSLAPFSWEPRDNWSIPIWEELGVEESHPLNPFITLEVADDNITFKTFDNDAWEFIEVEEFKSEEKLDSFIKSLTEAKNKLFGVSG